MKRHDRVAIKDKNHPWHGMSGELVRYEKYGPAALNLEGWLVQMTNGISCYANEQQLQVL